MKILFKTIIFLFAVISVAQEKPNLEKVVSEKPNFEALDSLYREDQFYLGISYNSLQNKPMGGDQGRFTPSFSIGILRDMPFNKNRTWAVAAGLGYAINNYNQNIQVFENSNNTIDYQIINTDYEKNKLVTNYIELPVELRWRNSTPESHKFWRVYAGFKASYLVYNYNKYVDGSGTQIINSNPDLNKLQLGTYLSFGYNTINFNVYYGLSPIYKTAKIDNELINMRSLNFGFMFYIL